MALAPSLMMKVVTAHLSRTPLTQQELLIEIINVFCFFSSLEATDRPPSHPPEALIGLIASDYFLKDDAVYCMICGVRMTSLGNHLRTAHEMGAAEYRARFRLTKKRPLLTRKLSEFYSEKAENQSKKQWLAMSVRKGQKRGRLTRTPDLASTRTSS